MGGDTSKHKIKQLEDQHRALQKKNEELLRRMDDQKAEAEKQNQAAFEQMAKMMLVLALAQAGETSGKGENVEIDIEGTVYQLIENIGQGGFGEVHKAKIKNKDKLVAIKIMKNIPAIAEEVKNEVNFLLLVREIPIKNHPVILCYGSKTDTKHIFIAMELAAIDLLNFWVQQISAGDNEKIVTMGMIIIVYVLRALTFLEQLNIIHGDIKPQNLVIVPNGEAFCVKLIDFGTVEKMTTRRADLTVDATKAYTAFFASPEFLKRDSKNLVSRRLHKKSDAWAAGVMFYLLFCGELPWKDAIAYENFCNDSRAADVVVPEIGGFKMIIELLLKKNPNDRASAKATLLQLKAHPTLGQVIDALHNSFCPVDDVCTMRVPDKVRDGLLKMGRSHLPKPDSSSDSGKRRPCRYGKGCYRKDISHREEFAHPGDSDYSEPSASSAVAKTPCHYGAACYRKDPQHREKYSHPTKSEKPICQYGSKCRIAEESHRKNYSHAEGPAGASGGKEKCHFGPACKRRDDKEHMKKYLHDAMQAPTRSKSASRHSAHARVVCIYGSHCHNQDPNHRRNYIHVSESRTGSVRREECAFGKNCTKLWDQQHLERYFH